jgi:hypothetical protein
MKGKRVQPGDIVRVEYAPDHFANAVIARVQAGARNGRRTLLFYGFRPGVQMGQLVDVCCFVQQGDISIVNGIWDVVGSIPDLIPLNG